MALSIGIVGLPNVGKSTLFNALTKNEAEASNYPFCTIDPNVGIVKVPDERLQRLADVSAPEKIIPTTIEFVDIAGLVKGAHEGEGLGNKFLSNIRECTAICQVVRDFNDDNVIHVNGKIDPQDDRETINTELVLADLASVEKKLDKVSREARSGDKEAVMLKGILEKIQAVLAEGNAARTLEFDEEEEVLVKQLQLITTKPVIYILNTDKAADEIKADWDGEVVAMNVKLEEEIASLPEEEQKEYIEELGLDDSGLNKLVKASYRLLGLVTYFTTGKIETRAWTTKKDSLAPVAAGEIHSDFEKQFIRAEVIKWEKFVEFKGEAGAREKGALGVEGKDYVVQDGDVCNFLIAK